MKIIVLLITVTFTIVHTIVVNIPELGKVIGSTTKSAWSNKTIYQFFSIKYGVSPSGKKRFQPPELIKPWENMFDATIPGLECPSIFKINELLDRSPDIDSEDCLSLNVFTPTIPDKDKLNNELLPVMVFIHGGGFLEGGSNSYPPNYLLEYDVLLVVPQYRLGPLGFLSLQTENIAGNVGLMDQLLALKWVNLYIEHFGGDNSRVTLMGQSSGACSVSLHLLSPIAEPHLFQRAIIQSGSSNAKWIYDTNPDLITKDLFKILTNTTTDVNDTIIEDALINAPLIDLYVAVKKQITLDPTKISKIGRIVIQKAGKIKYLTEHPTVILKTGMFRTLPMMLGATKHDGLFLLKSFYDELLIKNLHNNDDYLRNGLTKDAIKSLDVSDESGALVNIFNENYFKNVFNEDKNITFKDVAPGLIDVNIEQENNFATIQSYMPISDANIYRDRAKRLNIKLRTADPNIFPLSNLQCWIILLISNYMTRQVIFSYLYMIFSTIFIKAQILKQAKINSNYEKVTHLYTMDYRGEHSYDSYGKIHSKYLFSDDTYVDHADELLYLFPYPYNKSLNKKDENISKLMSQLWTSFAIGAQPKSSMLVTEWPTFKKGKNGPYLHINEVSSIGDDFVSSEYFVTTNSLNDVQI